MTNTEASTMHASSGSPPRQFPWRRQFKRHLVLTDTCIVVAVTLASQALRINDETRVVIDGFGTISYWLISAFLSALWLASLAIFGVYDSKIVGTGASEYARIARASLYLFGFIAILSYVLRAELARSYLAIALPLGLFGLVGGRWVWRRLLAEYRAAGSHLDRILIVGSRDRANELAQRLQTQPTAGFMVAGLCLPGAPSYDDGTEGRNWLRTETGFAVAGGVHDIMSAIEATKADIVAVETSESFGPDAVRELGWKLEGTDVRLALAPALTDVAGPRIHIRPVADVPLMYVEQPQFRGPKLLMKTSLDYGLAGVAVILLIPLLLTVAFAIKISDPGPVFFRQNRVGFGGHVFRVWKFRTMVTGAESALDEVKARSGQSASPFYKSANDQRITRIGSVLRKTSIDELPQLFNVLAGQMSLVGPRPLVPGEGAEIGNFLERRRLVRPGITGLWQVSGRSDASTAERIRLDFYYVENWSVTGDLMIIGRTIRTVIRRQGAY